MPVPQPSPPAFDSSVPAQSETSPEPAAIVPVPEPSLPPALQPPDASSAVFDAPGMPGVRMMAPIPDKPPPASTAAAAAAGTNAADRAILKRAFEAASRDWNSARRLAAEAGNPVARLFIEWLYLLDETSGANFAAINAFLNEHPNWPRREALFARAEKAMPSDLDPKDLVAWYGDRPAVSGTGMLRLGNALMQSGKAAEGAALIREAWIESTFTPAEETQIAAMHAGVLGPAEHRARLDHLLAEDDIGGARRQMARVDAEAKRIANARLKIKASPATVKTVLASLSAAERDNPELLFDAARALRRRGQDQDAWDLMKKAPASKDALVQAERWSFERQIMARNAFADGKYDLAYQFASAAASSADSPGTFADSEFLAGWIALRFLHNPELARSHFDRLTKGVSLPITVARAQYWLGRTAEAMNQPAEAAAAFRTAASHSASFYGQLALANMTGNPILHLNAAPSEPTPADRAAFEADERVQAIRLLSEFGDRNTLRLFAIRMANDPPDAKRLQMLAQLMASAGDPAMSVRVAKTASYNNLYLPNHLHPVVALPSYSGNGPEPALVLGLTRQESEFDPAAVSSAGARGLMQLMPASARHAASTRGMTYRINDLTANPSYNIQLGMATISEYLERWGGSYVLAIASYNAGPNNVRKWVETFGDPRDPGVDPIDWIESIPFPETRNYVQRVLENVEVYRNRLSGSDQKLAILADIYRPSAIDLAAWTPMRSPSTATAAAAAISADVNTLVQDSAAQ